MVPLEGESGCGKELVAREIHLQSRRQGGAFVAVNCAALVETLLEAELFGIEDRTATGVRGRAGKFELANGGTLFLDEVGDLSPTAQAKLLRAIQDMAVERVGGHATRTLNVRLVVATNRCLGDMVRDGLFRADLYYRLSGVEIHVPPLRERRADIPLLATHFLSHHPAMGDVRLSAGAADALRAYDWPGNVRELQRVIERAVALSMTGRITLEDLPARVTGDYVDYVERLEPSRAGPKPAGFSGSAITPYKRICVTGDPTQSHQESPSARRTTSPAETRGRKGGRSSTAGLQSGPCPSRPARTGPFVVTAPRERSSSSSWGAASWGLVFRGLSLPRI